MAGLFSAYMFVPHVARRIKRFMDPASGDTFQVDIAMESFARGGWFGQGPGEGMVKRILPDSHTDFVFAVAAEEFGIILCLVMLSLFAFIVLRSLTRAYAQRGPVHALRCLGPCDPVRHPVGDQHGGEPASDSGEGHDAAVHVLWRLLDDLAGLRHGHDAGADAAAPAHRDGGDRRADRGAAVTLERERRTEPRADVGCLKPWTIAPLILLAAGGTGGHLFPAEALGVVLIRRGFACAS